VKRLMFVLTVAVLLAVFGGGALAQTAPQGTLDANNLGGDEFTEFSTCGAVETGQQFTAESTGRLTSAQVRLGTNRDLSSLTGSLTMEITEAQPSGTPAGEIPGRVLASTTISASEITDHLVTGVFSSPAQVVAGQHYVLLLRSDNTNCDYQFATSGFDPYPGGWALLGSSSLGWSGYGTADLIFATYVSSPDTTPPSVTSTVPKANATQAAPTANVRATFSEEMDSTTINGTTFQLFKKGTTTQIAAQVSYNADTDTAKLDPNNNLRRGVAYKAVVTTEAKDVEGNRLDQDASTSGTQQMRWFFRVDD
jgi:hypothetical protein